MHSQSGIGLNEVAFDDEMDRCWNVGVMEDWNFGRMRFQESILPSFLKMILEKANHKNKSI